MAAKRLTLSLGASNEENMQVAQTTGAWVVTGGTNTGVMKHVGEALQGAAKFTHGSPFGETHRKVYCIGIATWGIVEHRNQLKEHCNTTCRYFMANSIKCEGACLDNNHTHFLLVDNGTESKYGAEIKFRAELERRIMKMDVDKNRSGVPAVLLVLEGGPNTILTVYEAITGDPAIPVVVIKDSGRASDLLAFTHSVSQGEGPFYDFGDVVEHKQLLQKIEQTYPELDQSGCLMVYSNLLKCVERKNLITIFKMEEGSTDIDQAILTALLKSKSASPEEQLKLALIWNRPDIARSQIFSDDLKWHESSLEDAMKEALEKDRTDFVELFLEHGVNVGSFLTKDRLEGLYSVRSLKGKSLVKYFLGVEKCRSGAVRLRDIKEAFCRLTSLKIECTVTNATGSIISNDQSGKLSQTFEHPFNELFIWAVLNNMQKMALLFWKSEEEAMAKALIACKLYSSMVRYAKKRDLKDDIVESLKKNEQEFQLLAVQLLDQCSLADEKRSSKLLTYELTNWGCSTCLTLAVSSQHEMFVAHSCCQELLNDMWAGAMSFRTYQSLKTFCCMVFPPIIPKLNFRSKGEIRDMPQTVEQHEEYEREEQEEQCQEQKESSGAFEMHFRPVGSVCSDSQFSLPTSTQKDNCTLASDYIVFDSLKWWEKIFEFYAAPITKFWGNVLSYLVFLGIFTYVVLGRLTTKLQVPEVVLIVFVISLTTEELRQLLESDSNRLYKKLQDWAQSKWNLCDGIAILLFYVGLFLRLNGSTISAGHVIYSIDIIFWIIRLLDIFSVNEHLGPYVVMIGRMTLDLLYFLFIMAVFLSAYGVSRQSILDLSTPASWKSVAEIFFTPYWQTYGELFINKDNLYSDTKTYFGTKKHNGYSEPIVSLLMALYLLVANILLLNLLIAIFNNTFAEVQANSNKIWKFQRYHLIMEYSRRPSLVPPFVIINHVVSLCKHIYRICKGTTCCRRNNEQSRYGMDKKMKYFAKPTELIDLLQFEEECVAEYLRKKDGRYLTSTEERIRLILERVDNVRQDEESKEEIQTDRRSISMKISRLDDKIEVLSKNLQNVVSAVYERYSENDSERKPSMSRESEVTRGKYFRENGNSGSLLPRRFLSHNPYMHLQTYENSDVVKEAAWNFRKSSLKGESPTMKDFADALQIKDRQDLDAGLTKEAAGSRKIKADYCYGKNYTRCPEILSFQENRSLSSITLEETDFRENSPSESDVYYPMSDIKRFPVPNELINWEIDFASYNATEHTSPAFSLSLWVDPTTTECLKFNNIDEGVDRISNFCKYDIVDGRPRNPFGRTGLTGRGLLPRWGPNHATKAFITRWKRSPNGKRFLRGSDLYSLEILTLQCKDRMAIPSAPNHCKQCTDEDLTSKRFPFMRLGIVARKKQPPIVMSEIFDMYNNDISSAEESLTRDFLQNGHEIFLLHDDPRNTDNAWIELYVVNYHDDEGKVTENFSVNDVTLCWKEVDSELGITLSSLETFSKISRMRNAYFDY